MEETKSRCLCHFLSPCPKTVGVFTHKKDEESEQKEENTEQCFFTLTENKYSD